MGPADEEQVLTVAPNAAWDESLQACKCLGLKDDRDSRAFFPVAEHRCFQSGRESIGLDHQSRYCLGPNHGSCPRLGRSVSHSEPRFRVPVGIPPVPSLLAGAVFIASCGAVLLLGHGDEGRASRPPEAKAPSASQAAAIPAGVPDTTSSVPAPPAAPVVTAATPEATPIPPTPALRVHVVEKGESLWSIALANGTTVDALKKLNGISSDVLYTGDIIRLPN